MNYWFKGISRRWKDYRLVMIVTFIAAVFMSGMLLLQNIMNAYIMEQNYQYYGDWIVAARDEPLEHPYLSEHGRLAVAGNEIRDAGGETLASPVLLGSLDEALAQFGRITLYEGHLPENRNEIVADRRSLEMLGLSYDLGQEIVLTVVDRKADAKEGILEMTEQVRYTLCGVVKGFASVWASRQPDYVYPNLLVSEEELSARYQTEQEVYYSRLDPRYKKLDVSEFLKGFSGTNVLYNSYTYGRELWGDPKLMKRVTGVMMLISAAAIVCLLVSYTDTRKKSYYRFRCLGMSKRKLTLLIAAECLFATVPAVLAGVAFSYLAALLACRIAAAKIGGQMFFDFEFTTLFTQLAVLLITVLVSTLFVILRMSGRKIAAGTGEYGEKQLKILSKRSEKEKAPVRHFPERLEAVHPAARIAFILMTVLASGFMAAAFWPVTKALDFHIPEYRNTSDFYIGVNDAVVFGQYVDSPARMEIQAPNPFLGFSEEEITELRETAGIRSLSAETADRGHQILWEGMENSPILDAHYAAPFFYEPGADPEKIMERVRSTDPRIKMGGFTVFDYTDTERLRLITEKIFDTKLTPEELERWEKGDLLLVIVNCDTRDPETGEEMILTEDTLKSGDTVEIRTLRQEGVCRREVLVIENRMTASERMEVGKKYSKYRLVQLGYVVMASERFFGTMEQLEGKERRYNGIEVWFSDLASYEATDKVIAEAAAAHDAYYSSEAEAKQRILDQEIIEAFGVYGVLFAMTYLIYLILARYYLGVRLARGRTGYRRFRQLGLTKSGLRKMIFRSECKNCLWVFPGAVPGAVAVWLMNVYQFAAEKQAAEASGSGWGFFSTILNRDSENVRLLGLENIFFYSGFRYMFAMLSVLFLTLLCMTYFSARREAERSWNE
ncbi:MAG: ABC transporter permease [Lachnospiraceae bacterium]|nr:ABC transporter permease [Lachnospiraceae bacterium]